MRPLLVLLAVLIAVGATQARASLQPALICIDPDMEFPVACDDDDD
jgi:hypothetical protein